MAFKQNRTRFLKHDNLMFLGAGVGVVVLAGALGYGTISHAYIWALLLYSTLILLFPTDISKTCVEKRMICFSLCVVGGVFMEVMKAT